MSINDNFSELIDLPILCSGNVYTNITYARILIVLAGNKTYDNNYSISNPVEGTKMEKVFATN